MNPNLPTFIQTSKHHIFLSELQPLYCAELNPSKSNQVNSLSPPPETFRHGKKKKSLDHLSPPHALHPLGSQSFINQTDTGQKPGQPSDLANHSPHSPPGPQQTTPARSLHSPRSHQL
uniref:Uncharacterized protein n=1 Tax=Kalanchoe fedtschenkoi TaxID=63787 RepID=A0A7N0TLI3_KALFE